MCMNIRIDGRTANRNPQMAYRGLGVVSGNNSSRLLMDYRSEHPEAYWKILNLMFGRAGLHMAHLKVEMGADINSSSGTEPSVKRSPGEAADVTRGAAYQLAADAKKVNPDLTMDMLWWSEPKWVSSAEDVYAARYRWYKETLDAAWQTYGLKFDYVSAVQNERAIDGEWVKYLSAHLKAEKDCPYDYAAIKIVAGDEVCTWVLADMMLADEDLLHAVDVLGSHYTSWSTENAQKLAEEHGKELWFSEACPSMCYAAGVHRYDGKNSGLTEVGGALDIANRVITMYPGGRMTLCEIQPAIAAYYDGVTYCSKQLILADEPWSGAYSLDSSFYALLHFAQFIHRGWQFVDSACFADGRAGGGDGHAVVDATHSCMTAMDPVTGDYSLIITNTTAEPHTYDIAVEHLGKAAAPVYLWETRGPDQGAFDENYFAPRGKIVPTVMEGAASLRVTVQPWAMVTLSTLDVRRPDYADKPSQLLELPYADDYACPEEVLAARGSAPRYTTDQGGAFEVRQVQGKPVLVQLITMETKAEEWGATPSPVTCFGDDRWYNYAVASDVLLADADDAYVGVGLRYVLGGCGENGYWARLQRDGRLLLMRNDKALAETAISGFDAAAWHRLRIAAENQTITVHLDGALCIRYECEHEALLGAGRAALYSSYHPNCFAAFRAEAIGDTPYITRYDDTDAPFTYSGPWEHTLMGGWKLLRRTCAAGEKDAGVSFAFVGRGFLVLGENEPDCLLQVSVDGVQQTYETVATGPREAVLSCFGLAPGAHEVQLRVLKGRFCIDGVEIIG